MTKLLIVGAGGLGKEILWLIREINRSLPSSSLEPVGFVDVQGEGQLLHELPVLGDETKVSRFFSRDHRFIIAVGNPGLRKKLAEKMEGAGFEAMRLVHPRISLAPSLSIGKGSILCAGVTPTVDIQIGAHCLVNLNCTIGHDCLIGDYSTLHPGAHLSGNSRLGEAVEIGTGAVVLPGMHIGPSARLGAGAVLTRDLPTGKTYVGVPARPVGRV